MQLSNVKFHLKSTSIDWLQINDDHAIFSGKATVNNEKGYEFLASAVDVDIHSKCHKYDDMLRIIVWNNKGEVVFDNQPGDGTEERPCEQIGSGSIVIHKEKSKCNTNKSISLDDPENEITSTELFSNLKVYPNPASKVLYVEIPERSEQAVSFDIVDVTGRIIIRDANLELWGQNSWINLEQYPMKPGFYMLSLKEKDGNQTAMVRFIKQ